MFVKHYVRFYHLSWRRPILTMTFKKVVKNQDNVQSSGCFLLFLFPVRPLSKAVRRWTVLISGGQYKLMRSALFCQMSTGLSPGTPQLFIFRCLPILGLIRPPYVWRCFDRLWNLRRDGNGQWRAAAAGGGSATCQQLIIQSQCSL